MCQSLAHEIFQKTRCLKYRLYLKFEPVQNSFLRKRKYDAAKLDEGQSKLQGVASLALKF